jgi:hypothetical protein
MLLLRDGGEWTACEVAAVLGLWFRPYSELHKLEQKGKITSRWLDMPYHIYPRRRVYFAKGTA